MSLDLPSGQGVAIIDATLLPPGQPEVGDVVDAKVFRGQVTAIKVSGRTIVTSTGAVGPANFFLVIGLVLVCLGLMFAVAYTIDRRAGYI